MLFVGKYGQRISSLRSSIRTLITAAVVDKHVLKYLSLLEEHSIKRSEMTV
jgi:hypothetical protein